LSLIVLAFIGFLLLEPFYFIAHTFPQTICYYNGLVGGINGAYGNYEMDYYYNSIRKNCEWFIKNELPKHKNKDTIYIASNASHIVSYYFRNEKNIKVDYVRFLERNQQDWDYCLLHIALIPNEFIRQKKCLPPNVLNSITVQGNMLSAIFERPSYYDVRAYNYLNEMKFDSAIIYFNQYLQKDSNNTCILNALSKTLLQTNLSKRASLYAKQSYSINSSDPDTKLIYGITLIETKQFHFAKKLFNEVVQKFPDDMESYFYLAVAQKNLKEYDGALNNFDRAANNEKYRASSLKMMGDIYMEKNMKVEAMKMYKASGFLD
jgi:tetratricopeptide (TPR) repeat protein